MRKLCKFIAASVIFAGCSTTAFAGAQDTAFKPQTMQIKTSTSVQYASTKKVVQFDATLPKASKVATQSTRTVLFYNAKPTRSKKLKAKAAKTSTPNLFQK